MNERERKYKQLEVLIDKQGEEMQPGTERGGRAKDRQRLSMIKNIR